MTRTVLNAFRVTLLALGATLCISARPVQAADLKLASFFGDHMVLQREREFAFGARVSLTPISRLGLQIVRAPPRSALMAVGKFG